MDIIIHVNLFDELVKSIEKVNYSDSLPLKLNEETKRKYLFFLNPVGGRGNSIQIWESIQPILCI